MADFNNPLSTQGYLALLSSIVENNQAALTMLEGVTPLTNLPVDAKRWNNTNSKFEKWNGAAWGDLSTLFEMKVRNSDQLNGQTEAFYRNAGNLNAGTLAGARFADSSHGNRGNGSLHAVATAALNGFMSASDKAKLDAIEAGATGDMSGAEILSALLPVDGPGTGLNADLLDNYHASDFILAANGVSNTHDHAGGDGAQIPTAGIVNNAITGPKLAHFINVGSDYCPILSTAVSGAGTLDAKALNAREAAYGGIYSTANVKVIEVRIPDWLHGTIRLKLSLTSIYSSSHFGRIYIDDSAVGTERFTSSATDFATEDFAINGGERIQVYVRQTDNGGSKASLRFMCDRPVCLTQTIEQQ